MKYPEIGSSVGKLDYIDIVRAIAILMVILIHTSQRITGLSKPTLAICDYGQMGVQLFFIASAYTLCYSHVGRMHEKKPWRSFFIRRFFRIAPLYYLAIIGYFWLEPFTHILTKIRMPYSQYNFESIAANVLFVHGFVVSANNNIVPGGWSIGTEMAFYVIFPMLFALFTWTYKRRGIFGLASLVGFSVLLNIAIQWAIREFFLFMIPFQGRMTISSNPFIYWNLINNLPVFLIGMTIFFCHQNGLRMRSPIFIQVGIFTILTICCGFLLQFKTNSMLMFAPTYVGISFVFLLNILRESKYSNRLLEKIGQASYSMYIFHFIFAWYLVPMLVDKLAKIIPPDLLLIFSFVMATGLTFLAAVFSQKYIESPGIKLGRLLISRLQ